MLNRKSKLCCIENKTLKQQHVQQCPISVSATDVCVEHQVLVTRWCQVLAPLTRMIHTFSHLWPRPYSQLMRINSQEKLASRVCVFGLLL